MRFVRASNLDAHDRKRFNELLPRVDADVVVAAEFNNYVEFVSQTPWVERLRIVTGPVPRLSKDHRRRKAVRG